MNELVIYPKKGKMILYGIGCLVFVAIGGILFLLGLTDNGNDRLKLLAIGGVVFVFFGLCMVYWVKTMVKRKPAIIINHEGITDQSTYIAAGLIRWGEIEDIDFIQFGGQTYLGIFTKDPDLIVNRSSSFKRMLNRMNKGLLPSQVNIPVKILDCSVEVLIDRINKEWEKQMSPNEPSTIYNRDTSIPITYPKTSPPFTCNTWPVTKRESSEAR